MKISKFNENNQNKTVYTVLVYSNKDGSLNDVTIFDNEQSAENYVFNTVNSLLLQYYDEIQYDEIEDYDLAPYKNAYIFTKVEDALDWCQNSDNQYIDNYSIEPAYILYNEEINPEYKIAIDASKYNM